MARSAINNPLLDTPCIGICSTVYGDIICRGCKREYKEVIEWNNFDTEKRHSIYQRLSHLMSRVVSEFLTVTQPDLLKQQLEQHHIRSRPFDDAFCLAHHALRIRGAHMKNTEDYGISIKPEFQHLSLSALFTLIDEKLHEISSEDT